MNPSDEGPWCSTTRIGWKGLHIFFLHSSATNKIYTSPQLKRQRQHKRKAPLKFPYTNVIFSMHTEHPSNGRTQKGNSMNILPKGNCSELIIMHTHFPLPYFRVHERISRPTNLPQIATTKDENTHFIRIYQPIIHMHGNTSRRNW